MARTDESHREAQLRDTFRRSLPGRVRVIMLGWQRLKEGVPGAHEHMFRPVHGLAGTAGTFGFEAVGERARELQGILAEVGRFRSPAAAAAPRVEAALGGLLAAVEGAVTAPLEPDGALGAPSLPPAPPVVALIERTPGDLQGLADELHLLGYATRAGSLSDAAEALPGLAVLCDLGLAAGAHDVLHEVRAKGTAVVAVTAHVDSAARLAAARLRVDGLLSAGAGGAELSTVLERLRCERVAAGSRILLVDDEPDRARRTVDELATLGFEVVACQEPGEALRLLSEGKPDAVLVQVTRPGYSDLDLLHGIRCQDDLVDVPVVLLTPPAHHAEALALGADDVRTPDLSALDLASVLSSRAARGSRLRRQMSRDVVTGLLNRQAFEERLKGEMARAWRDHAALSLAVLDLDRLKVVNDTLGHVAGDRVLAALGRVLRERLRESDVAARIGGDELAIILPGTGAADAREVVDALRRRFAARQTELSGVTCVATVSAGIACYPDQGSPRALLDAADGALYRAKRGGRNRVEVAGRLTRGRILLVDDDELLTELWRSVLEGAGFDVAVAHDGLRGYEMARERKPDLVVSDLLLPHLHGFKLCRRLSRDAATRHIPVVLTTGIYRKYADEVKAKGCGARGFIRKPVAPEDLLARVTALVPAADTPPL